LIRAKLKFYHLQGVTQKNILEKIAGFSEKDFILDLRPFVPLNEREKLKDLYVYIQHFLKEKLVPLI